MAAAEQTLQWQGNVIYESDGVAVGWFMFSKSCLNSPDRSLKVKKLQQKAREISSQCGNKLICPTG